MKCKLCTKALSGRQSVYCSGSCKTAHWQFLNGLKRKKDLVCLKGGKCERCGYSKNLAALAFHHSKPEEKVFKLDMRTLTNTNWEAILKEAAKCELLCHNCHSETHYPRFDIGS
jgi:hypothetical protein